MVNTEHIGLLLWQEQKERVMEKVVEYLKLHDHLSIIKICNLKFVNKADRSAFVRKIYEGEDIPDDNPKITSDATISFVMIEDRMPEYEWATTGSGKRVFLNTNSSELKAYVRKFYHWKHLHSTDDYNEFISLLKHTRDFCLHEDPRIFPDFTHTEGVRKFVIDINELYYYHINYVEDYGGEVVKFRATAAENSPHYDFVKDYMEDKDFTSSDGYHRYVSYLESEKKWHGETGHSPQNFIDLINSFDYNNYNKSLVVATRGHTVRAARILVRGIVAFKENPPYDQKDIDIELSSRFTDGLTRYAFTRADYQHPPDKREFFIVDGLHRAAILYYHNIKSISVFVAPLLLDQLQSHLRYQQGMGVKNPKL